jgi:RND family efflux transporter MFP subunit
VFNKNTGGIAVFKKLKVIKLILAVGLSGLLLLTGCSENNSVEQSGGNEEPLARVSVIKLEKGILSEELRLGGELSPWRKLNVYPEIPGKVISKEVSAGDRVAEGDLLLKLDDHDYRLDLSAAEASLGSATAQLREGELSLELLRKELADLEALYETGAVAERDLLNMRNQVARAEEALKGAGKMVAQAEIQLALSRQRVAKTEIRSPIDGVVSAVLVDSGDMAVSQAPVVVLEQHDPLKVVVTVDERYINELKVGQNVVVEITAAYPKSLIGQIYELSPSALEGTRSFPVTIKLEQKEGILRPGMYADVIFDIRKVEDVWLAPESALVSNNGEYYLYFVKDGLVKDEKVEIGMRSQGMVEVYGDFDPSLDLIANPSLGLSPGQRVEVGEQRDF